MTGHRKVTLPERAEELRGSVTKENFKSKYNSVNWIIGRMQGKNKDLNI